MDTRTSSNSGEVLNPTYAIAIHISWQRYANINQVKEPDTKLNVKCKHYFFNHYMCTDLGNLKFYFYSIKVVIITRELVSTIHIIFPWRPIQSFLSSLASFD